MHFILFQRATYCDMYPVTSYTMEIKQFSGSDVQTLNFRSATNHIIANDLSENEIYKFRMTAWNSEGSVSSDAVEVCKLPFMHFQLIQLIVGHGSQFMQSWSGSIHSSGYIPFN